MEFCTNLFLNDNSKVILNHKNTAFIQILKKSALETGMYLKKYKYL